MILTLLYILGLTEVRRNLRTSRLTGTNTGGVPVEVGSGEGTSVLSVWAVG